MATKWKKKDCDDGSKRLIIAGIRHQLLLLIRRRHRLFPFISVVSGCLLLLLFVTFSLLSPPTPLHRPHVQQTSVLSKEAAEARLYEEFGLQEIGASFVRNPWISRGAQFYYGCCNAGKEFQEAERKTHPDRYLLIATSGGLNQQRTGIVDSVVAAYMLNATLVVPKLDQKSYWKDNSDFDEIFDVSRFISFLSKDVKIIKELPGIRGKAFRPYSMRVPRKCTPTCYQDRVLPVLNKKGIVQLSKFDYRLSNRLDADLQKLRCRVNYHALQFTDPIREMGQLLVQRMRMRSERFIALHLRFEPDMLAFSGCYYGGGDQERNELGAIRKRWKSLNKPNPEKGRRRGRCPLTPEEIGLMLKALGFESDIHLYVASGEVYRANETLKPLRALFPNFYTKESLASKEELAPFAPFSSRMAALDFIVSDESDVFVANNNGNMARMLAGRRRYFGHKVTIRPNAKKLYKLFMNANNMTWEEFAFKVRVSQVGFMGEPDEIKPDRGEFHENPSACICGASPVQVPILNVDDNTTRDSSEDQKTIFTKPGDNTTDLTFTEDDPNSNDVDYFAEKDLLENSYSDHILSTRSELLEFEALSAEY